MKFTRLIAIATLMLAAQSTLAEFTTITRANEVTLSEFRLPSSANGSASFKACSACDRQTVSVSAQTWYQLNDQFVSLPEMRRALALVSNRDSKTVIVRHHMESDLITQI